MTRRASRANSWRPSEPPEFSVFWVRTTEKSGSYNREELKQGNRRARIPSVRLKETGTVCPSAWATSSSLRRVSIRDDDSTMSVRLRRASARVLCVVVLGMMVRPRTKSSELSMAKHFQPVIWMVSFRVLPDMVYEIPALVVFCAMLNNAYSSLTYKLCVVTLPLSLIK
mgnify:CR=1 FL=1